MICKSKETNVKNSGRSNIKKKKINPGGENGEILICPSCTQTNLGGGVRPGGRFILN